MNCVDAGNVLVHLFLQTSPNYVLTNKKLQYLLIIAQVSGLSCGRVLFEDDIRNFRYGFVLDTIGNGFLSGSAIVNGTAEDMPISRDAGSFVLPYSKKKIFEISEFPSSEEKKLLIDVFLAFGAYRESTLCGLLNEFRTLRKTPAFTVVPKKKISEYISTAAAGNTGANNVLFAFIRAQNQAAEGTEDLSIEEMSAETVAQENPNAENKTFHENVGTENAPAQELIVEDAGVTEDVPAVPQPPRAILKGISSLQNIVAGKRYSVLAEVRSRGCDCRLSVFALNSNQELPVVREVLSDTLYRFSFDGVASDIKISAMLIY